MAGIDVLMIDGPVIEAIGWALLHFVWQGALVGALAAVALRLLRRGPADVRYVIAAVALSLMATLPVVTGVQAYRASRVQWIASSGQSAVVRNQLPAAAGGVLPDDRQTAGALPQSESAALPAPFSRMIRWMPLVVLGWMAGVGILAVRLGGGWIWMQRLKSHGAMPADAALQAIARRLSRSLHISRTITLLRSPGVDVPTVIGWLKPTVVLPMSALSGLSPLQVEAILAHELAHVRRHDYFVNLLQTLLETLLFYHPAVWWVSGQIRTERENCCDDLAVSLCGDPVIYASALADLEDLRGPASPLAMAASGGVLLDRVRRLLTGPAPHAGRGPAWLAASSAALLVLVVVGGAAGAAGAGGADGTVGRQSLSADSRSMEPVIPTSQPILQSPPAPPSPPSPPAPPSAPEGASSGQGTRKSSSGNFIWSDDGEKISIKFDGAFEINDDDSGIKSISPGGYLHVSDGEGHLVEFISDRAGTLSTRYKVNNRERAFEPEGRQWLATIMPRFVRRSGFGASGRVARFLRNGGVPAVLAEISRIESSYAKKLYFSELLQQAAVDGSAARRILEQAGREIESDYELASLLISGMGKLMLDQGTQKAFFDAARTLESDYEMRRVFSAGLERGPVPAALTAAMLDAARELDSDYEAASLLLDLLRQQGIEGTRDPFFAVVSTLSSAYEKGRVLQAVLRRADVSSGTLLAALNAAGTIGSGYETSQVLQTAARAHEINGPARDVYMKIADRLGDYEQTQALAALARNERRK